MRSECDADRFLVLIEIDIGIDKALLLFDAVEDNLELHRVGVLVVFVFDLRLCTNTTFPSTMLFTFFFERESFFALRSDRPALSVEGDQIAR